MLSNPSSSSASMTSCATLLSLAEDKEEEEEEEWMASMFISPSFRFGDSNLRVENEETDPVPREGLRREDPRLWRLGRGGKEEIHMDHQWRRQDD